MSWAILIFSLSVKYVKTILATVCVPVCDVHCPRFTCMRVCCPAGGSTWQGRMRKESRIDQSVYCFLAIVVVIRDHTCWSLTLTLTLPVSTRWVRPSFMLCVRNHLCACATVQLEVCLQSVAEAEGLDVSAAALRALAQFHMGDLRACLLALQVGDKKKRRSADWSDRSDATPTRIYL